MNVLVVAPHPDDETLGCGGALLKHGVRGDKLHWLIMTAISEDNGYPKEIAQRRQIEINDVTKRLNFKTVHNLGHVPAALEQVPLNELVSQIGDIIKSIQPDILYLPFSGDAHSDHRVTFEACFPCTKIFRYPSIRSVRIYETLSETDFGAGKQLSSFVPNFFVNIEKYLEDKLEILEIYESEMQPAPFPRNAEAVKAQALLRGQIAGSTAAEAFMILREID